MTGKAVLDSEWVPVPKALLKALGWAQGQRLALEVVAGVLVVEKAEEDHLVASAKPSDVTATRWLRTK